MYSGADCQPGLPSDLGFPSLQIDIDQILGSTSVVTIAILNGDKDVDR